MLLRNVIARNLLVICIICIQRSVLGFCPAKCACNGDHNLRVSCKNASLADVPIQLNPEAKYINLTINQITKLNYALQFYTQVEVLDLSRNRINELGSKNFEFSTQLRTLNLSQNQLEHLHKDAFFGLKGLLLLDLSHNKISRVHPAAMTHLIKMIDMDFSNNAMISFDDGVFKNLTSMERLTLEANELVDVPVENLVHLRSLKSLDLSGNLIEFIRNDSFGQLKELNTLKIVGNVINDVDVRAFDGLPNLRYLDLGDNNLTIVPTQQLSKLSNLSYLSMSGNSFISIPPVALLNLFHLRELHLDKLDRLLKIDSRAFVDNTFLQIITLDENPSFADLPLKLFHGNPNLIEISIRGNDLHTLDAAHFPLDRLHRLRLAKNPLVCNCSLLWLWRLTNGQINENSDGSENSSGVSVAAVSANQIDNNNDDTNLVSSSNAATTNAHNYHNLHNATPNNVLILDVDEIACDLWEDSQRHTRNLMKTMSASDIKCPAHIVTIVSAVLSVLLIIVTGASVLFYMRRMKNRRNAMSERKNVNERIVPQQVDKLELERYLAAQAVENEYRALRQWELTMKEQIEEPDHYEKFDDFRFDTRRSQKPHVVYV
ncbi:protein slit [Contarinia nasturtii]|uniref:protein slit n=1 Tax=Contarinia nasturtii TaxID=265458 RepID=UPI0012D37C37|nr:protein slit [Contarinia nasturtii]XP_031630633.1 protein slit [Contarinia nasturtii]XP_031630644.1 protein slit [Contarinia nasturtii]